MTENGESNNRHMEYRQPRETNGHFAKESIAAVYDALTREVKRIDALRTADQVALSAALLAAKTAVDAALAAAEKAVAAALIAAKEAVTKAEVAQQRTNEGQNEFRGQLKDQAATLLPRTEYYLAQASVVEKIENIEKELQIVRSRVDVGPPSLSTLQAESDRRGGRDSGTGDTWKIIVAIAGFATGAIGILLNIVN